jgi:hypothetical protein
MMPGGIHEDIMKDILQQEVTIEQSKGWQVTSGFFDISISSDSPPFSIFHRKITPSEVPKTKMLFMTTTFVIVLCDLLIPLEVDGDFIVQSK